MEEAASDSFKRYGLMGKSHSLRDLGTRLFNTLSRRHWPLHQSEDIAPFFIIGAGRSGTTLLRRMLVASKQVHIPPETYVLAQVIEHYKRNAYQDWQDLVRDCMALFEMHPEFDTFQISLRPLLPQLRALPEHERSLAKMLDMFYRYHGEQTGMTSERWGDKTPINTFALDAIVSVFPKARFIHLLRDGVDVVHSFVSTGLISDVGLAATRWRDSVQLAYDFSRKHPTACLEVRYEALICDAKQEMKRICAFLDLPYNEAAVEQLEHVTDMGDMQAYTHYKHANQPISSQYLGKGRKALSAQELADIGVVLNDTLQAMGYTRC